MVQDVACGASMSAEHLMHEHVLPMHMEARLDLSDVRLDVRPF